MTIVVYGEALVDDFTTEQVVGGAPFNVARHLAAFMAPQLMVTRIGNDHNGAVVHAEFERFAMSEAGLQIDKMEETGRVVVERTTRGHRFVILPGQAYDYINPEQALAAFETVDADCLYFGTLAQRCPRSRDTLHALLEASAAHRFLDLNLRDGQYDERCVFHSLHAADLVKVNEEELQLLFRWYFDIHPEAPPLAAEEVRAACAGGLDCHARPSRLGVFSSRWRGHRSPRYARAPVRDRYGGRGRCVCGDFLAGTRAPLGAGLDA